MTMPNSKESRQLADLLDSMQGAISPRCSVLRHIGRRGASLLFVAFIGIVLALSLLAPSPAQVSTLGQVVPLKLWAVAWSVTAALCVFQAFRRNDRLAFAVAVAMFTSWAMQYIVAWVSGVTERGYLAAAVYIAFGGWLAVIATWPEALRLPYSAVNHTNYPDAVITANERGQITGWLGSAERLFGWPAAEILGRQVTVLMPERYRAGHSAAVDKVLKTGVARHEGQLLLAEALRRDGTEFTVQLFIRSRQTDTGVVFITVVRDPGSHA